MRRAVLALHALLLVGCERSAPPPRTATTVRLLALGDSFTIGTGSSPERAFPARLAERWRNSGCDVQLRNVAVNGYSTRDVIELELAEIERFHPTVITFAADANDIVRGVDESAYRANVAQILRASSTASVLVLPQPLWSRTQTGAMFGDPETLEVRIRTFDTILRQESERAGARFIDLSSLMTTQAERGMVAGDGLHPSAAAHDEWAEEIARRVTCR